MPIANDLINSLTSGYRLGDAIGSNLVEAKENENKRARQAQFFAAIQEGQGDPVKTADALLRRGFVQEGKAYAEEGRARSTEQRAMQEHELNQRKNQLEIKKAQMGILGSILAGIKQLPEEQRPAAWQKFKQAYESFSGEALGEEYSPEALDRHIAMSGATLAELEFQDKRLGMEQRKGQILQDEAETKGKWILKRGRRFGFNPKTREYDIDLGVDPDAFAKTSKDKNGGDSTDTKWQRLHLDYQKTGYDVVMKYYMAKGLVTQSPNGEWIFTGSPEHRGRVLRDLQRVSERIKREFYASPDKVLDVPAIVARELGTQNEEAGLTTTPGNQNGKQGNRPKIDQKKIDRLLGK